jgi:hypothetical protein
MSRSGWPDLHEKDRWLTDAIEDALDVTTQTAEQLRERAAELRSEAASEDLSGVREATLAFAGRLETHAASRLAAAGSRGS